MAETMDPLRIHTDADASLGSARMVQAEPVVAGEFGTWQLVYTVGPAGLANGGAVRIVTDSDTDWGWPQVDDPPGPEYMTATGPPDAEVALVVPEHITVIVINTGRPLAEGESVTITYGDRSGGGPGSRSQTFLESRRYFWFEVDSTGSGSFGYLPERPELAIVGGDADKLVVVAPSIAAAGEEFKVSVKAEDRWGNPAMAYRGTVRLSAAGIRLGAAEVKFGEDNGGVVWIDGCRITEPGEHRITAKDDDAGLSAESNPVVAMEDEPELRLYWGDPHGGQVVDPYKFGDFFEYARDVAGIHFAGFQRNDHVMTTGAYEVQQQEERRHYEPGRFVPLPGYEWSATSDMGGHHNIYFRRFDQALRRCGHRGEVDPSDIDTDLPHVTDMHAEYRHTDVVVTPHVGGTAADLRYHEPSIEPALEITSTHGQFEWFLRESLERKYRMGFVGGSDCYTGRPGDDHPGHQLRRYQKAGLTGLYATDLSLEAVLAALKARRVYATSGVRIVAAVSADGNLMGAEYSTNRPPAISVKVIGTGPIERVEVFRGLDVIHSEEPARAPSGDRVRVTWEGASRRTSYSGVVWDGSVSLDGGEISAVSKVRFDSPRSDVTASDKNHVRWHSWTCGYRSGLVLDVDGGPPTVVTASMSSEAISGARYGGHGESAPQRMSLAPADCVHIRTTLGALADGPRKIDLGVLDRKFTLELAPEPGPERAEFEFTDESPKPGINPYWVRVTQSDMEMAWTSPVFVDYVAPL